MKALRTFLRRLSRVFGKKRSEADLTAKLESNLDMQAEEYALQGMDPDDARRRALLQMGGVEQTKLSYRQQETLPFLETFLHDARYGLRMLRKNPGFTAIAVVTLALGIGANTAIFSIVNGVLLRPLPYEDPERLFTISNNAPGKGYKDFGASPPDFRMLRDQNHTFTSLSAFYNADFNLTGADRPERVSAAVVSAEYFATLGVRPMLGRTFLPGEEKWGSHRVMVVSESFWRSHLNADPNFSKTLSLDGEAYEVIGVMAAGFYTRSMNLEAWVPMAWKPKDNYDSHNNYFLNMVGRMKPGVTPEQAYADLNSIMLSIAQQFPENKGIGADLQPLSAAWLGPVRPALMILLAAVGLVLLIACVNLANLLLARSAGRRKEIGIRSALGASRGRLLRQFLTETVLLALLGGATGLGLAFFSLRLLPLAGDVLPRVTHVRLDDWVLAFTAALSLATGLLFGLLPALQNAANKEVSASLKEGGRSGQAGQSRGALHAGLVISEVALAVVLLIGSGLAIRSLQRLLNVDRGFTPQHVLTFQVSLPQSYDPNPDALRIGAPPQVAAFYREFLERIEHLPGVKSAGAGSTLPLRGENWGKLFTPLDKPLPTSIDEVPHVQYRSIAGHYFQALGIHLIKGRLLDERDRANAPFAVVVNETLAHMYWPNENPIGKMLMLNPPINLVPAELVPKGFEVQKFTVVGVVGDVHYGRLNQDPAPLVYATVLQHDFPMGPNFVVSTDRDPTTLVSSIRGALNQFDKQLPLAEVATMEEIMSESVAQPRLEAVLLGLFGGLAMVLAAVGIYGVMSYSVNQRTGEIGVRMALGADRGDVLLLIAKQGLLLAIIGLGTGLVLSLAGTRLMSNLLFGISPTDPLTFVSIMVLLGAAALLACYIPARRATKVDPMIALRHE
jgi:predicted permease